MRALPCSVRSVVQESQQSSGALLRTTHFATYLFELRSQERLRLGLFLENKAGEKGDHLGGLVVGKDVVEDQLGQDELVGRVDLDKRTRVGSARRSQLERDTCLYSPRRRLGP